MNYDYLVLIGYNSISRWTLFYIINIDPNDGKTMENKPPMTGNFLNIPPIKMVMTGRCLIIVSTT